MDIPTLEKALQHAWSIETSTEPGAWDTDNPSRGQSAPTALIINDTLGGDLLRTTAILPSGGRTPHYYNKIGENIIDFTRHQFSKGTTYSPERIITRDHILSDEKNKKCYILLEEEVQKHLPKKPMTTAETTIQLLLQPIITYITTITKIYVDNKTRPITQIKEQLLSITSPFQPPNIPSAHHTFLCKDEKLLESILEQEKKDDEQDEKTKKPKTTPKPTPEEIIGIIDDNITTLKETIKTTYTTTEIAGGIIFFASLTDQLLRTHYPKNTTQPEQTTIAKAIENLRTKPITGLE